jgi:pyruvate formate-lyase activating enzyme-like uncharacterized protein
MNASADALALSGFLGFLSQRQVTDTQAAEANRLRNHLLDRLQRLGVRRTFYGSKLFTGELSPGCARCVAGTWSCVFLTKQCTANCFFCPSSPSSNRTFPRTNRLPFSGLEDYLAFLRLFEFQGASFSGGEPLLRFEETLAWIARIKQELGTGFYVWLYTNGDLIDERKLRALQEAGLDEIRINIAARDYELRPVRLAREFMPTVTVEIPALPEDEELLQARILDLARLGLDHLNLHQLFANQVNYRALAGRNYTFLPLVGAASPALESEISALRLLLFTLENQVDLPINYCSLVYRTRSDELAHRRRAASVARAGRPYEALTETGCLRRLSVTGSAGRTPQIEAALRAGGYAPNLWRSANGESPLLLHASLLGTPELAQEMVDVRYVEAEVLPEETSWNDLYEPAAQLERHPHPRLWIGERLVSTPVSLPSTELAAWLGAGGGMALPGTADPGRTASWKTIKDAERMARGLQPIQAVSSLLEI